MVALLRIDNRLIHGQITTAWMSSSNAKRIIIASDDVANDAMRKMVVDATAPKGTKVLDIKSAAETLRTSSERIFVICAAPKEVLALAQEGVEFDTVIVGNVGGIEHNAEAMEKTKVSKSVFLTDEDIAAFNGLRDLGIKCEIRVVPKDRPVDIYGLIDSI